MNCSARRPRFTSLVNDLFRAMHRERFFSRRFYRPMRCVLRRDNVRPWREAGLLRLRRAARSSSGRIASLSASKRRSLTDNLHALRRVLDGERRFSCRAVPVACGFTDIGQNFCRVEWLLRRLRRDWLRLRRIRRRLRCCRRCTCIDRRLILLRRARVAEIGRFRDQVRPDPS